MNKVEYAQDRFALNFGCKPGIDCDEEETRVAYNVFQLKCSDNYTPDQILNLANNLIENKTKQGSSDLSKRGRVSVIDFALLKHDKILYRSVQTSDGRDKTMEFLKNLVKLEQYNV